LTEVTTVVVAETVVPLKYSHKIIKNIFQVHIKDYCLLESSAQKVYENDKILILQSCC